MTVIRISAIALALLAMGCGKDKSDTQGLPAADNWQAPDNAQVAKAAAPQTATGSDPHAGVNMGGSDPHAGVDMGGSDPHAGVDMGGGAGGVDVTEMGLKPPDPNRVIDNSKFLKGTLKPTDETKSKIPPNAVIFLSVKRADPKTGQPVGSTLAVKRLQLSSWPLWFHITEEDAMVGGTQFQGEVVITAWSDGDSDAISKNPGDVIGTVRATIPSKDLTLVLDKVL